MNPEYFEGTPCPKGHTLRYVKGRLCVQCRNERHRAWYAKNREGILLGLKTLRKVDPDKTKAKDKRRYWNNKEKHDERTRIWRLANSDKMRESARAWRAANPDKMRIKRKRVRDKRRGAEGKYSLANIQGILEIQNSCCVGCGISFSQKVPYTIDHIIPVSRGGSNWPLNLQLLCSSCNDRKGACTMEEWKLKAA